MPDWKRYLAVIRLVALSRLAPRASPMSGRRVARNLRLLELPRREQSRDAVASINSNFLDSFGLIGARFRLARFVLTSNGSLWKFRSSAHPRIFSHTITLPMQLFIALTQPDLPSPTSTAVNVRRKAFQSISIVITLG